MEVEAQINSQKEISMKIMGKKPNKISYPVTELK